MSVSFEKCLTEVDEILNLLDRDELKKIPADIRKLIKDNKDKAYIWKYDKTKNLANQNLNRKTIAFLSYLNMEYLLSDEEKNLMNIIHKENRKRMNKFRFKSLK